MNTVINNSTKIIRFILLLIIFIQSLTITSSVSITDNKIRDDEALNNYEIEYPIIPNLSNTEDIKNKVSNGQNIWTIMAVINADVPWGEHAALDCLQEL